MPLWRMAVGSYKRGVGARAPVPAAQEGRELGLRVAPRARIDGGIAGRQGEARALAFVDDGDGARRKPSALGCRCERALRQAMAVGRIEEGQGKAAPSAGRPQ